MLDRMQNSALLHAFIAPLFQRILNRVGMHSSFLLGEIDACNKLFLSNTNDETALLGYVPSKVDVYSLGASIMILLERSHQHGMAVVEADEPFYIDVFRLCRHMLNVSPRHRVTAALATKIYNGIVRAHLTAI